MKIINGGSTNINNESIVANNSIINGNNNRITANNSIINGNNNTISGNNNTIKGNNNKAEGNNCSMTGNNNKAEGNNCSINGNDASYKSNQNNNLSVGGSKISYQDNNNLYEGTGILNFFDLWNETGKKITFTHGDLHSGYSGINITGSSFNSGIQNVNNPISQDIIQSNDKVIPVNKNDDLSISTTDEQSKYVDNLDPNCKICFERKNQCLLLCKHTMCVPCWNNHSKTKTINENGIKYVLCPFCRSKITKTPSILSLTFE
jgi:hypothetical protein